MNAHIAVVDVGATNSRVVLLDPGLNEIASRKAETRHLQGPPYLRIDSEALIEFVRATVVELDAIRPVDTVSVSAFGATIACLDAENRLVHPIMDYLAPAPESIEEGYAKIAPPFEEVFSNTSPGALTLGKQLYWLETQYPESFTRVAGVVPWSAYIAHRLGGGLAMEISNLGVFTHLIDVRSGAYSSLVRQRGWERLFPERRNAWDVIGTLTGLRGKGEILAGIHDSNANWLRYMAGQSGSFTLLSTGTFVIGFDSSADLSGLSADSDAFSFNDVFGRPIGCARFYGGYEFRQILDGVSPDAANDADIARVIDTGLFALPAFSETGGPFAGRGGRGKIVGGPADNPSIRASLATLYYALMVDRMLDVLRSKAVIIVDGPAAQNPLMLGLIAALRPGQQVMASQLSEGTTLGAGVLALMKGSGTLPRIETTLVPCAASKVPGLERYRENWINLIEQDSLQ